MYYDIVSLEYVLYQSILVIRLMEDIGGGGNVMMLESGDDDYETSVIGHHIQNNYMKTDALQLKSAFITYRLMSRNYIFDTGRTP